MKKSLSLGFFLEFLSKMKLFLILAIPFLQVACTSAQDIFITNDLPEAKIDQPYSVKILMRPARLDESSFKVETNISLDTGLTVLENQGDFDFPHTTTLVEGKPKIEGKYYIIISGANREASPKYFSKEYELIVTK